MQGAIALTQYMLGSTITLVRVIISGHRTYIMIIIITIITIIIAIAVAVEEAIFLTKFATKVILIHRRDKLRAEKMLQKKLMENKKMAGVHPCPGTFGVLNFRQSIISA